MPGGLRFVLILPDGSKSLIPADWTDFTSSLGAPEPAAVGAESSTVVHAARQVHPVDRIDLGVPGFLKIHHAQGLFRIGHDIGISGARSANARIPPSAAT
jgi:hypothetical protein